MMELSYKLFTEPHTEPCNTTSGISENSISENKSFRDAVLRWVPVFLEYSGLVTIPTIPFYRWVRTMLLSDNIAEGIDIEVNGIDIEVNGIEVTIEVTEETLETLSDAIIGTWLLENGIKTEDGWCGTKPDGSKSDAHWTVEGEQLLQEIQDTFNTIAELHDKPALLKPAIYESLKAVRSAYAVLRYAPTASEIHRGFITMAQCYADILYELGMPFSHVDDALRPCGFSINIGTGKVNPTIHGIK